MSGPSGWTRREFLRRGLGGAAALSLGWNPRNVAASDPVEPTARVVLVRDPAAVGEMGEVNGQVVTRMLDEAVCALFRTEEVGPAWRRILRAEDILGIKSNIWPSLPTPAALESALRTRALEVGIKEERISIDDQGVLHNPVFQRATALINIRPLRTHHWAGIGGCLKNYIMFSPFPPKWHPDSCADLGGLWHLPICRGKTRLNVLVVLTPLFHGVGPHHFDREHTWAYGGLLVGTDPVALDALGVKLLAEKRKRFFERPPRGGTSTKHVSLAETRHGIGVAALERIEVIRLGWMEEALI